MGFLDKLFGEAPEVKAARRAMQADLAVDPRRGFVVGILAVSYEVDPGYLKAHATEALTQWYDVRSAAAIEAYRFGVPDGGAYDAFRHAFLARAGFAAQLRHQLEDLAKAGGANGVSLGLQSAGRIACLSTPIQHFQHLWII